ncbi:MAG: histidine kinase [Chitinophagaceae bacterium]|nr:histidine kinase [Chitinophagaceae bacterium]
METPLASYLLCIAIGLSIPTPIAIYFFTKWRRELTQKIALSEKLKLIESRADLFHLESLEARLNPHLFKNILNSIQSHAYQTYFALDKVASVLDYVLYESRKRMVTPAEEIDFAMNFIEINKIKISPLFNLNVKTRIGSNEPLYNQNLLAPLVSIDLIENAFKHADIQSPDAFISIVFEFRDNTFSITVSNKVSAKSPMVKERSGLGTETLNQRLKIIYKNFYTLERFVKEDVYISHLKIYLLDYKTKVLTAG